MKIAIIATTFAVRGGAENMILKLAEELLRRGHYITIFTSEYNANDPDIPDSVRSCFVEVYAGGHYSTWLDWLLAGLRLRTRLQHFDVVNPHNFPANVWVYFARLFSRSFPPIIWYCHEPPRQLYDRHPPSQTGHYASLSRHIYIKFRQDGHKALFKLLQKSIFYLLTMLFGSFFHKQHISFDQHAVQACDLVLTNSRYTASKIDLIYHISATVCYQGISSFSPPTSSSENIPPYFLTVSRLEQLKHVDTIIKAMDILVHQQQQHDVSLMLVGTGTEEARLHELVRQLNLQQHVIFPGYVTDDTLHHYYSEALAVVYVPEDEPFGLVPLEAMMHATPVITSNSGGTLETVQDQETGLHVEPGNADQLADAMLFLCQNPEKAIQMGKKGYQHVMRHWTLTHFVDRFEHIMVNIKDILV